MHALIVGKTGMGKTVLASNICAELYDKGITTLVASTKEFDHKKFKCDYFTTDPEDLLLVAKTNTDCHIFIDEAGAFLPREPDFDWFATQSREPFGHICYFMSQRARQIHVNVRSQCANVFMFNQSEYDRRIIAEEFADSDIIEMGKNLRRFEYIKCMANDNYSCTLEKTAPRG